MLDINAIYSLTRFFLMATGLAARHSETISNIVFKSAAKFKQHPWILPPPLASTGDFVINSNDDISREPI
jgi:uncharacterized membrane protein